MADPPAGATAGGSSPAIEPVDAVLARALQEMRRGLVLAAAGLGTDAAVGRMLARYSDARAHLVLVLVAGAGSGAAASAGDLLERRAARWGARVLSAETPAPERAARYVSGGLYVATPRVVVVDLLARRLPAHVLTGVVVLDAHRARERGNEAFIVRMVRRRGGAGAFVRALTDCPDAVRSVPSLMRALHLTECRLFPRAHAAVAAPLMAARPDLVELHQPLSDAMKRIQSAVRLVARACLDEIRRADRILDPAPAWDLDGLLAYGVDSFFLRELGAAYYALSDRARAFVEDLRALRSMLHHLLHLDPVSFFRYVEGFRTAAANATSSGRASASSSFSLSSPSFSSACEWVRFPEAAEVFRASRERVYAVVRAADAPLAASLEGAAAVEVRLTLEPLPKWLLFREVMAEIEADARSRRRAADAAPGVRVLVVAGSLRALHQLRRILCTDPARVLADTLRAELRAALAAAAAAGPPPGAAARASTSPDAAAALDSDWPGLGSVPAPWRALVALLLRHPCPGDQALVDQVRSTVARIREGNAAASAALASFQRSTKRPRGGANSAAVAAATAAAGAMSDDESSESGDDPDEVGVSATGVSSELLIDLDAFEELLGPVGGLGKSADGDAGGNAAGLESDAEQLLASLAEMDGEFSVDHRCHTVLCTLADLPLFLESYRPGVVVVVDPDPCAVRQLEVYQASLAREIVRVYWLVYDESSESEEFMYKMRAEKEFFERARTAQLPRLDDDLGGDRAVALEAVHDELLGSTRAGGVGAIPPPEAVVLVDQREFRASLPNALEECGFEVVPTHLEVGDYILSPNICVERKSIPDLIGSTHSGRLFHQVEAMARHFPRYFLLIEFDDDRPFRLEGGRSTPYALTLSALTSKLSMLVLNFPALGILWARDLRMACELFRELKKGEPQPDTAAFANRAQSIVDDAALHPGALEFLRRLPGTSDEVIARLAANFRSLQALIRADVAELTKVVGAALGAQLHALMHRDLRKAAAIAAPAGRRK